MRSLICTGIVAASLCAVGPRPAEAWGGGFLFGTTVGLAAGAVVGSTLVRPYPYLVAPPPYGYPLAYGYPPPYAYPAPYGNGYPPPGPGALAGYPAPAYRGGWGYASATPTRAPSLAMPTCRPGQFFNTLTDNCDRR